MHLGQYWGGLITHLQPAPSEKENKLQGQGGDEGCHEREARANIWVRNTLYF